MKSRFLAFALVAAASSAYADDGFNGRAVVVVSGSLVEVAGGSGPVVHVRLANVEAPGREAPFGVACRHFLSSLVSGRDLQVKPLPAIYQDRPGEVVAVVTEGGRDVGLAMVTEGCAWHANAYGKQGQTAEDFSRYVQAQTRAKNARAGFWVDPSAWPSSSKQLAKAGAS